jgi:hypothetical protein
VSEANGSAYNTRGHNTRGKDKSFQRENAAAATSRSGSEKKNTADSKNMTVNKIDCEKAAAATSSLYGTKKSRDLLKRQPPGGGGSGGNAPDRGRRPRHA